MTACETISEKYCVNNLSKESNSQPELLSQSAPPIVWSVITINRLSFIVVVLNTILWAMPESLHLPSTTTRRHHSDCTIRV